MQLDGCTKEVNDEKGCRGNPAHFSGSMEKECSQRMKEEEEISVSLKIMGRDIQGIHSHLISGL